MEKRLLIAGLDPGTTTAYAVLDINGMLIKSKSQKNFGISTVISEIMDIGKAVVVGTDKGKVPGFVEAFSMKTGARVERPNEDLKTDEKREVVREFGINDEHQNDAIAAAFFAFRKIKPLIGRIDSILEREGKREINGLVKELVLTKKISIYHAIKMIEAPENVNGTKMEAKVQKKEFTEIDFFRLREKLKSARMDNIYLKMQNEKLMGNLAKAESAIKKQQLPSANRDNEKLGGILNFKERRLRNYFEIIREKERTINQMRLNLRRAISIITNGQMYCIMKKLDTLGSSQYETRKVLLNIKEGDILFVDNPNIVSRNTVEELKDKISVIVHNKMISKKLRAALPFIFINSRNLEIDDLGIIAAVEKSALEVEKEKHSVLLSIVEKYKKERVQLS